MLSRACKGVYLIQILLPLYDNEQRALPRSHYQKVRDELTKRYHGLTAYTRAPAEGLWQEHPEHTSRDEIVIYEVMVSQLDPAWWRGYRRKLEALFRQEMIVIRVQRVRLI